MKKKETKKNRKSNFNPNRPCYLSADGKFYCYEVYDFETDRVVTQRLEAFGTMAEDGNLRFITSLTSVGETYDSVAGSAQNLFDQTGTPMQEMEANTRRLQQALIPLGEKIVELANVVLPPLVAVIETVSGIFGMLPEPVQNFVVILGALLVAFTALTPVIAALSVAFGALNISLLPVIGIIAGVAAAIAAIIAIVKNWGAITEWFGQLWETVSAKLMELWDKVVVLNRPSTQESAMSLRRRRTGLQSKKSAWYRKSMAI